MKKLSRIAALLAAGALLFGAVGCSDDDNGGGFVGVQVNASVAPAITLDEGGTVGAYVVTFSVIGDTFSDDIKSINVAVPTIREYLKLTASDTNVIIGDVTVNARFNDTEGKVNIKVAALDGAKSGTIKVELLEGMLKNTTGTVTATPLISYTIKGDEDKGPSGLNFPLSMKPTTEGSTPAYPTAADLEKNAEFKFTSPVSYTVCTKKKFDSGKYNTGTDLVTADRWNLGGALESSGKYNCYMKFDSAPSEKMTVKFFNTNVDRTITVVSGTDKTVGTVKTTKTDGTNGDLMSETFTVTKGSEVYLGATASGIWVAEIVWEE